MSSRVKNCMLLIASLIACFVVLELALRVSGLVRNVGPAFSVYDAKYGKQHKANFSAIRTTPESTFRLTTDSRGMRGPEPDRFPYRPLLFLGVSFTEGYGVDDGKEFPALVRKDLKQH